LFLSTHPDGAFFPSRRDHDPGRTGREECLAQQTPQPATILSIAFSIWLLTIMMTLWRSFYIDQLGPASALRLFTRPPHVFFAYAMPTDYRQKIKSIPGVVAVAPLNLFNGVYKDNKRENGFPPGWHRSS